MQRRIEKVAVLGAGTMGARISANLANAGVPSYLIDIVPPDADGPARNRIAAARPVGPPPMMMTSKSLRIQGLGLADLYPTQSAGSKAGFNVMFHVKHGRLWISAVENDSNDRDPGAPSKEGAGPCRVRPRTGRISEARRSDGAR